MTTDDVLTASVRIAAPAEAVFPYLVDSALIVEWIGEWADLTPVPGGTFALDISKTPVRGELPVPGGTFALDISKTPVRGEFREVDPPRRVVFTWGVPGRDLMPPGSTTVEIILTEDGGETLVELFHHDLPAEERPGHLEGWIRMLGHLAALDW